MRIAIVDDIKEERERLAQMIEAPFSMLGYSITGIEQFACGEAFLQTFAVGKYDVVFLDIFMGASNGIETAKKIRENDAMVKLVFVTTSNDFASESYMVDANGYLLKPYSEESLYQMLGHLNFSSLENTRIIHFSNGQSALLCSILYTSYSGHYVSVYLTTGETVKVRTSQASFTDWVSPYPEFFCCNKGLLVNLRNVKKLESDYFVMTNGTHIPVSRRKLPEAKKIYTEYLISQMRKGGR